MTSLNFVSHPLSGKSLGWVWRDQSPSNVNSYFASSQAVHSSSTIGWVSPESASSSHKILLKAPSSLYQTSRCSITVDLNTKHPLPGGGAVHWTYRDKHLKKHFPQLNASKLPKLHSSRTNSCASPDFDTFRRTSKVSSPEFESCRRCRLRLGRVVENPRNLSQRWRKSR